MEKSVNNEEDDKKEISAENEDEGLIQIVSTEYQIEINRDTMYKLTEEFPYGTSPIEMEEGVNNEDDDKK